MIEEINDINIKLAPSTLTISSPYHFGWKHHTDGGGTIQKILVDNLYLDVDIYKNKKPFASLRLNKKE